MPPGKHTATGPTPAPDVCDCCVLCPGAVTLRRDSCCFLGFSLMKATAEQSWVDPDSVCLYVYELYVWFPHLVVVSLWLLDSHQQAGPGSLEAQEQLGGQTQALSKDLN